MKKGQFITILIFLIIITISLITITITSIINQMITLETIFGIDTGIGNVITELQEEKTKYNYEDNNKKGKLDFVINDLK